MLTIEYHSQSALITIAQPNGQTWIIQELTRSDQEPSSEFLSRVDVAVLAVAELVQFSTISYQWRN